jgi:hypothetical protein
MVFLVKGLFVVSAKQVCPYEIAKLEAVTSPLAFSILPTSWLRPADRRSKHRNLVIMDEADTLEPSVMGLGVADQSSSCVELGLGRTDWGGEGGVVVGWIEDGSQQSIGRR